MALGTAYLHLTALGLTPGRTILINGAGATYAGRLRDLGAAVTGYGDGVVQRVKAISEGPVDLVLNTAPVGGALPDLVEIAGGDPSRVLTISDVEAARQLRVRHTFHEGAD